MGFLDTVISPEYRELNRLMHQSERPFGGGGADQIPTIKKYIPLDGDILDYGCGKRALSKKLGQNVVDYDPGIPGLDGKPGAHDYVVCSDVLEHVEPEFIDAVLRDIARVVKIKAFFRISTQGSTKYLADGSDPHRIIQPPEWWEGQISSHFNVFDMSVSPNIVEFVVESRRISRG